MGDLTICEMCNQAKNISGVIPVGSLNKSLVQIMRKEHPNILNEGSICLECLNHYRTDHMVDILEVEKGSLTATEKHIVGSIQHKKVISKNINNEFEQKLTIGEKAADAVATFGGSWSFIISFIVVLIIWIGINTIVLLNKGFDPYPFILLNLILSCIAALQSPIIMMSQNRKEAKDRMRAENDYEINLKTELEMRRLHDKVDYLMKKIK